MVIFRELKKSSVNYQREEEGNEKNALNVFFGLTRNSEKKSLRGHKGVH